MRRPSTESASVRLHSHPPDIIDAPRPDSPGPTRNRTRPRPLSSRRGSPVVAAPRPAVVFVKVVHACIAHRLVFRFGRSARLGAGLLAAAGAAPTAAQPSPRQHAAAIPPQLTVQVSP